MAGDPGYPRPPHDEISENVQLNFLSTVYL
jgi:hypothetical protein